jgi:hypothetical protein
VSDQVRILAGGGGSGPRPPLGPIVAVIVALVVGLLVGRITAPDEGAPAPKASPPAADGQPDRRVGTIGVGYPRTRAGAVAATLNAGAVLGDPRVLLDTGRRTRVLDLIATDRYARTFTGAGAAALDRAAQEPLGRGIREGALTISLTSPLAYRVTAFDGRTAKVVSWGVAVVGNDRGLTPSARWATTTTSLRWQDDDWKVDAASSTDGPAPGLGGQRPTDAGGFVSALSGSQGVRHAP